MRSPARLSHDPYAALKIRGFRAYLCGNVMATAGMQMLTVAIGWELRRRRAALATGPAPGNAAAPVATA